MERQAWQDKVHEIIYEADTPAGKLFDLALIASIIISVIAIMLDSIPSINATHGDLLYKVEWAFTITFTIEYILRIISIKRSRSYIFSFLGIIDLLSILPTYLGGIHNTIPLGIMLNNFYRFFPNILSISFNNLSY